MQGMTCRRLTALAGPPPRLKARPADRVDAAPSGEIGVDRVVDVQDIADLAAVAVDGDRLARERADEEMRDPALVLGARSGAAP